MPVLFAGKVPPEVLKQYVFPYLGSSDPDILHGPGIGRDAALIRIGRNVVVATTDPVTGAIHHIGAYALHICANDVATFGIRPRWFLATILLPEGTKPNAVQSIMSAMHSTAQSLDVAIIGGHTEITIGLTRPIVVGFMLGVAEQEGYVTSTGAQPDDVIILTKGVAIEGTAILATELAKTLKNKLDQKLLERAQQFIQQLSVVPEALQAMETGAVTAMHDPTEGGVANGLHELANASDLGFIVHRQNLTIHKETQEICRILQINPLNLIASGAMLIAVNPDKATNVIQVLKDSGITAEIIGKLVSDSSTRFMVESDGTKKHLPQPKEDALWAALKKDI